MLAANQTTEINTQVLMQKIQSLPPERMAEVVDFVEFLATRVQRAASAQQLTDAMARLDALNLPPLSDDALLHPARSAD